jgi:hypothetical protein
MMSQLTLAAVVVAVPVDVALEHGAADAELAGAALAVAMGAPEAADEPQLAFAASLMLFAPE